ncbi:MAG: DUF4115 domain-containing protein [Chloroflexi bacterium]|nr:DUF4115 domain-containing protein [Chloroflexota bacterium]
MLEALGATLRAAREARGWTLDEVERVVRIRAKYLAALEAGDLDALPSPLQARGFLRNYAQHLGLDPAQALSQLNEALQPARPGRGLARLRPRAKTEKGASSPVAAAAATPAPSAASTPFGALRRVRRLFTPDVIIALIVLAIIAGFFIWGGSRLASTVFGQSQLTQTPELIGSTATPSPTIIANITATFTQPPPDVQFSNVQLALIIEQRTFVRVTVDGAVKFDGLLMPQDRQDYVGQNLIEVTTGNGAGVRVMLNQRDLGPMGDTAEVVTRQYLPGGMITVTPTITFTPSNTAPPTDTPSPTATLTVTPTVKPTQTKKP